MDKTNIYRAAGMTGCDVREQFKGDIISIEEKYHKSSFRQSLLGKKKNTHIHTHIKLIFYKHPKTLK